MISPAKKEECRRARVCKVSNDKVVAMRSQASRDSMTQASANSRPRTLTTIGRKYRISLQGILAHDVEFASELGVQSSMGNQK